MAADSLSSAAELKQLSLFDDVVLAHTDEHRAHRPSRTSVLTGVENSNEVSYARLVGSVWS